MPMSPKLLRPRAASGFDPRSMLGLTLWLDAADAATLGPTSSGPGAVSNNGPVKYWGDKSGNGRNVTNSGADSVCPTFISNYHSGRPALLFDGGDVLSTTMAGLQVAPSTTFVAFDELSAVAFGGLVVMAPSSGNDFDQNAAGIVTVHDSPGNIQPVSFVAFAGTDEIRAVQGSYLSAMGRRVMVASASPSNAFVRLNGNQGVTDTFHAVSGTSAGILIGGRYISGAISGNFRFNGRIMEVLHYDRALSVGEITTVEQYISSKWGVSLV